MERPPALDPELVRSFVGAGHGNLEKVQELYETEPALLHASWDWGGGDWETALGAAAHTASRDVAEFLLEKGARMDIFCAVMLGKRAIVDAMLADDPRLATALGPHRIPLILHAILGKQDEIVAQLEALGAERPAAA
jgi:hypothetical protein